MPSLSAHFCCTPAPTCLALTLMAFLAIVPATAGPPAPALELLQSQTFGDAGEQSLFAASGGLHLDGSALLLAGVDDGSALLLEIPLPLLPQSPAWTATLPSVTSFAAATRAGGMPAAAGVFVPPVCGASDGVGDTEGKAGVAFFDAAGSLLACTSPNFFPYRGGELYYSVLATADAVYAAGRGELHGFGGWRSILARYDAAGALLWKRHYGSGASGGSWTTALLFLDGFLYLAGYDEDRKLLLAKVDTASIPPDSDPGGTGSTPLVPVWSRHYDPGGAGAIAYGLATDGTFVYVTGSQNLGDGNAEEVVLLKYDQEGNPLWQRTFGGPARDVGWGLALSGSRLLVAGETESFGAGDRDVLLLEIDPTSGDILDHQTWGGAAADEAYALAVRGGRVYVAAQTESFGAGGKDIALLEYLDHRLFEDGFESGDTASWPVVEP